MLKFKVRFGNLKNSSTFTTSKQNNMEIITFDQLPKEKKSEMIKIQSEITSKLLNDMGVTLSQSSKDELITSELSKYTYAKERNNYIYFKVNLIP